MKLSEHKDLKKEILALPVKEKDKLLLRLVAKDKVLTEHLHFLLLEDESNLSDRVAFIKNEITDVLEDLNTTPKTSAKDALLLLRKLTKQINHFYKVTKADFEEIELKLMMFNASPMNFRFKVHSLTKNHEQLLANYVVKSILIVLRKFEKLHEDLQFDLKEEVNKLLAKVYDSYVDKTALSLGLPKQID
ncbi:hypothetical protein [Pedobacter xixiisoli]|uniref:Uncharacterized protein n=1 Tax=Pedobacter xixiisoli TaxID=1476464 RepID=A0A286AF78_9SPHI|nr:hypothetical protein [Pedobacter xixiisoli]SOD20551.1 hypothetical protein SAMN06297358_4276 [Pedobacter xixiisoli]